MIYYVLETYAGPHEGVQISPDDDGSGKLVPWYQTLGFDHASGAGGGGLTGVASDIKAACLLKMS